ncbi:MAG: undecaprenyl-phosphate glucose phosphotransferase [Hyphomicrobiaceae bacterium]|nr:undecaprenyl-phosphate glucose phosphotransferase [Hyphomicrobiaceae bacterium]
MTGTVPEIQASATTVAPRLAIGNATFAIIAFATECLAILSVSLVCGLGYHLVAYGDRGPLDIYLAVGGLTALLYTLPFAFRDEYDIEDFLEGRRASRRIFVIWNYAFLCLALVAFLTKTTGIFSRGWLITFYAAGLIAVIAVDALIEALLRSAIARGHIVPRRIMLVGTSAEIARTRAEVANARSNVRVVATGILPETVPKVEDANLAGVLREIVSSARAARVDDIVLLLDWSQGARIARIVDDLLVLPAGVHVGAGSIIGRFANPRIARFGPVTALSLTGAPLAPMQAMVKRAFDVVVSALALALLAPVFTLLAVLIKLDSPGPVFFRQRRRGYNHEEFRIWKLRTMTTLDDGDHVRQASRGDARVTRVGRWLRRFNLDELPQLINVLKGEMSLVGPRPHAVAHDIHFETRILDYARRLNVKPGITGWAQIHGLRGATETEDDMRRRVAYDIHYIENWSLVLDFYILMLTVLSPKAYRNAF